ncbi:hypothetical protein Glove_334g39 [Diversispora epigaea]|uniref:Uncharacterized protein n=1 Tax=Diversispora epigaea TaxID=1348612 RepID=A0A397HII6_9GLOM|nr:hypothetical protein Glove_334g39 [Diversispora epigaea]
MATFRVDIFECVTSFTTNAIFVYFAWQEIQKSSKETNESRKEREEKEKIVIFAHRIAFLAANGFRLYRAFKDAYYTPQRRTHWNTVVRTFIPHEFLNF